MYTPHAFVIDDPAALDALFAHDPFVTVVVKHKLNQNHPVANRATVADALAGGGDDARAIAALMRALDP